MILVHFSKEGTKRVVDLHDTFQGQTVILVGGSPSLREQPIELLTERGVLTMAMNNAATTIKPTLWVSSDNPNCYEPQILHDPSIMKFGSIAQASAKVNGTYYAHMPNMYFFIPEADIPWDEFVGGLRPSVPWYHNTLFVAIHILYQLGIRRIILAGSDFGFAAPSESKYDLVNGDMYAHKTSLGDLQRKWNLDLYNSQAKELRLLKPIFEDAGLTLMDSSKNSRLAQTYEHVSLEKAVELCKERFPKEMLDPSSLPHCSKFAPKSIQKRIANWPGHRVVDMLGNQDLKIG